MSIPYSGSTPINYVFTDAGTRIDLVNKLNTQLKNAGWSVVSGDGTSDVLMKSAVTPQGVSINIRIYDPGSGNCAQVILKTSSGVVGSITGFLLPASAEWRIWACKYWFGIFRTNSINRLQPRGIVFAGTLVSLPPGLLARMGPDLELGFINSLGVSDTDASSAGKGTFRSELVGWSMNGTTSSQIYRSVATGGANAYPYLALQLYSFYSQGWGFNWADGSTFSQEAIVCCANFGGGMGMLADAMVIYRQMGGETELFTFEGKNWMPITDKSDTFPVTLCVVIP